MNSNTELNLILKKKWYEAIQSGIKKEEYREIKPYWIYRLCFEFETDERCHTCNGDHCAECLHRNGDKIEFKKFDTVRFHYGYTNKTMLFTIEGITIGHGHSEWGAPNEEVFIIRLGRRLL